MDMSRLPPYPISVPGYLEIRSHDDAPATDSFASSTPDPQAAQIAVDAAAAANDVDVGRSSAQVGIIIGTLLAFGMLLSLLYLLCRKRGGSMVGPVAWWQQRKIAKAANSANISDFPTGRAPPSIGDSTEAAYDATFNESKQNLVSQTPGERQKQSLMQNIRQAVFGAFKSKAKQDAGAADTEKGQTVASPEARIIRTQCASMSTGEWSQSLRSADMSIQTKSSMAIHPAVGRIKSLKKAGLRPGISAFSWSTTAPTPVPPSHATVRENPLPPLPSKRDLKRDTTLTTMTEDSEPTRHLSLTSWVENMRARRDKREEHQQNLARDTASTHRSDSLALPPPIANPNSRNVTNYDEQSLRLSALTVDSNAKTPALQTATMAWHVHTGAGKVEVSPVPRSTSRSQNPGLGLQDQTYRYDRDQNRHFQQDFDNPTEHEEYSKQEEQPQPEEHFQQAEGEYSQQAEHSQSDQYLQEDDYYQQDQYLQEHEPSQQQAAHPDYNGAEYYHEAGEYPQEHYEYDLQSQEKEQSPPEIQITSSEAMATIPEEWIPNVTRYPSGTMDRSDDVPSEGRAI